MSAHGARGRAWWPVGAGVCLTAVVLGLVAWQSRVPFPFTIQSGRSVGAVPAAERALAAAPGTPSGAPSPSVASGRTRTPARPPPPPHLAPSAAPDGDAGQTRHFSVTLYGPPDNDPPGSRAIAYPTLHHQAGGTGTFRDPVTFATSTAELRVGTVIYYPYLRRYFVMEDQCVSCEEEWASRQFPHIDLWAGVATDPGIIDCENALTQDGWTPVIVSPPANLPVDPTPLYENGRCYRPR